MKPLIRWTIGPVSTSGFEVLEASVSKIKDLYGNLFDYVICYNQINPTRLKLLGVELFEQKENSLPIKPYSVAWKLYPPRLRLDSHEIIIDNDIILFKKLEEIDLFLESNKALIYEGLNRKFTLGRYKLPIGVVINSGIYGLPPGFDFEKKVRAKLLGDWEKCRDRESTFDEQGLVASILYYEDHILISQKKVPIFQECPNKKAAYGFHFSGVNWKENYKYWQSYVSQNILLHNL